MERAVLPAAIAVKQGECRLGRAGRWPRNSCTDSPGWRMLMGVLAGEAGACHGVGNRVAFGGVGRSALKGPAGSSGRLV